MSTRSPAVGLEAHEVPGWLWRHAIWQGFRAMHQLVAHDGGQFVVDLDNRKPTYWPPGACSQPSASPVSAPSRAAA